MENILLIVHLILAAVLIAIVLLQRSEGGALGIGGGGGGGVSSRPATTPLAKATWVFAACFIATSLTLTIIAAQQADDTSVIDRIGVQEGPEDVAPEEEPELHPDLEQLLTPPPAADEPARGGGGEGAGGGSAPLAPPSAE
jgi:preprotein translocase subunit SecG